LVTIELYSNAWRRKDTAADVTLDSGAGPIALIRILGVQLRDGETVIAEKMGGR
jgi:hypothetical protein